MGSFGSRLVSIVVFLVTLGQVWIVASFIHELGHGLSQAPVCCVDATTG